MSTTAPARTEGGSVDLRRILPPMITGQEIVLLVVIAALWVSARERVLARITLIDDALARLAAEGHVIVISTHDVEFAARCASRV